MKKIISLMLIAVLLCGMIVIPARAETTLKTREEALDWVWAQVGKELDYDGGLGAQCVDLTMYYYEFLGVQPLWLDARDYATAKQPDGWTVSSTPQLGDIYVNDYKNYNHVGIVVGVCGNTIDIIDQNVNEWAKDEHGEYYRVKRWAADVWSLDIVEGDLFIHPKFAVCNHNLVHHDMVLPTENTEGCIEYWHCSICNNDYADAEAQRYIHIEDYIAPKLTITQQDAVDWANDFATKTFENRCIRGNMSEPSDLYFEFFGFSADTYYRYNANDYIEKDYILPAGWTIVSNDFQPGDILLEPTHDNTLYFTAIYANYKYNDVINVTEEYTNSGTNTTRGVIIVNHLSSYDYAIRPLYAHNHTTEYVAEIPATEDIEGTKAHYICTQCNNLFSDAEAREYVKAEDLVIPKLPHTHKTNYVYGTMPTSTAVGIISHWHCDKCGKDFSDSEATRELTRKDMIIIPESAKVKFPRVNQYVTGQFIDVTADKWYEPNVGEAYEFGLMRGTGDNKFSPEGKVTIAEAITMASRIHSIYTTGTENFDQGSPWYQVYLDYALENEIISEEMYASDVTRTATRAEFAEIFANALPYNGLFPINDIEDGWIPDVSSDNESVYRLYRAGILTGSDAKGTFNPESNIIRAEAAAIVSRMADTDNRKVL